MMKRFSALASLGLAVTLAQSGLAPKAHAIALGQEVRLEEAITQSTVIIISRSAAGDSLCTGSVLENNIVLTAAHCVFGPPQKMVIGFFNPTDTSKFITRAVTNYVFHADYNPNDFGRNDIALLKFSGSIPAGHRPAKLLKSQAPLIDSILLNKRNLVAGYGITDYSTGAGAGTLRKTELVLATNSNDTLGLFDLDKESSSCSGDSGGPAFIYDQGEYRLWGVLSFGDAPLCQNHSYYTYIHPYLGWIKENIRKLKN